MEFESRQERESHISSERPYWLGTPSLLFDRYKGFFPEDKLAEAFGWPLISSLCSAEVRNEWSYTSIFSTRLRGVYRDNCAFKGKCFLIPLFTLYSVVHIIFVVSHAYQTEINTSETLRLKKIADTKKRERSGVSENKEWERRFGSKRPGGG